MDYRRPGFGVFFPLPIERATDVVLARLFELPDLDCRAVLRQPARLCFLPA